MRLIVELLVLFAVFGVGVARLRSLWCYKCMGDMCNSPIDTENEEVWITECDEGMCFAQETRNFDTVITTRGCYNKKPDCLPLCIGPEEHRTCEQCCEQNLCNSATTSTFNLAAFSICFFIARFLIN